MNNVNNRAFTLIELMIVVSIVAFLAMMSVPSYKKFVARSRRSEAQVNLASLYAAEKAYWAENGVYTNVLMGEKGLGWKPEGKNNYSYGFGGAEGVNYIKGAMATDGSGLSQGKADKNSFVAVAVADIDGDGKPDVLTIDDKKEFKIVQDDLQ